jgi:hypothetical protein
MLKPEHRVWQQLAHLSTTQTDLKDYLESWYMHELHQLPRALTATALSQGRCQVLAELCRLFEEAPDVIRQS